MATVDLVNLSDAKAHLNIPGTDTSHDAELQGFIDAASEVVNYDAGPQTPMTYTETYRTAGRSRICLDHVPVIDVQSMTEYVGVQAWTLTLQPPGSTTDNYGFSIDIPEAGTIVRRSGAGTEINFFGPVVTVTYTAGQSSVRADVRMAVLEDIRGLYQQTQQGGKVGGGQIGAGGDDQWMAGPMHLFPRLTMLLEGRARTQSIA